MYKNKTNLCINNLLSGVLLMILLGFVGVTLALFTSTDKFDNKLHTAESGVYLMELFNPDDLWLPGETKAKIVGFGNHQSIDQVIRFTVKVEWIDADGSLWVYTGNNKPSPIAINWTKEISGGTNSTWEKIGDYFYYKSVLLRKQGDDPNELPPIMSSVTFSRELSNDGAHDDDFSNKTCRIYIEMETVDVNPDITKEAWNVTFTRDGNSLEWRPIEII